jgi:Divergent InlB B-repeat domain
VGRRLPGSLVLASLLFAATPALAQAKPPTPELIQRAEQAGRLDRSRADLFRTYAIAAPGRLPAAFRSRAPWEGTLTLLKVHRDLPRLRAAERREIQALLAPQAASSPSCGTESSNQANVHDTSHFHLTYAGVDAGLTVTDYAESLEEAWQTEVGSFGWAAPPVYTPDPAPGERYHVRIDRLPSNLYGFVTPAGDHAGPVGNNPATPWNDIDADASCMVLNEDFSTFPSSPQASLDSTTAHEFNHSIQFGYGGLSGSNVPDDVFVEGGATWMEDEVQDAANDNYNYLWPLFRESLGAYDEPEPPPDPYPYWITFRGLTERYGTGISGGGEQVMQDFWELTSKNAASNQTALASALEARGTTLAEAFHAYAIAVRFSHACGGGYQYPYCFEEGPAYVSAAGGLPPFDATVAGVGGSATSSVEDNYALRWITLPSSSGAYDVTLDNLSSGGRLRSTVACDTGTELRLSPVPGVLASGQSGTLTAFNPVGCATRVLVVTNESQTAANPASSSSRSFSVTTAAAPAGNHTLSVTPTGSGSGTVTSTPGGITCGIDCSESFPANTVVTLAATPAAGSNFAGWSGACSGTGPCVVTMEASRSIAAAFDLSPTTISGGADLAPPTISRLRVLPAEFRAARRGPELSATVGTLVSLRLSEAARVTFRVSRVARGRRVGGRCVRPTARNRGAPRCTRSIRLRGRIVRQLPAGSSRLHYRGRLAGRRLRLGRYLLLVQARDAVGNRSAVRHAAFRIVR